jgi:hemoglobin/transferrin/lactoferrin receptor protein
MPETEGGSIGFALQDTIGLPGGKLRVIPGLRFDYYRESPQETAAYLANPAASGLPDASSGSQFSPKLRVEWDALPQTTLYAQWAQGFRAPSATELFLNYGAPGTYLVIGNADLDPETVNGFEIGARFGDDRLGGGVSLYDNYYRNFIDRVSVSAADAGVSGFYPLGIERYINRPHVQIYGVEANAHWQFRPNWRVWTSIAFAHGRDTDLDQPLNSVPPLKGIFGLGYATENWGTDLSVTLAAARNDVEDPASDLNKTPGYGVVDLTGWWQPESAPNLKLRAGVFNIFDEKYWNALDIPDSSTLPKDYYTAPGRSFRLAMDYRF